MSLVTENISYKGPCIYCIWNTVDDRMYFGMSKNYSDRARRHRSAFILGNHDNSYLQNNYNKGLELVIAPVEFCKEEDLCEREKFWIDFYSTHKRENGFNLTTGGDGGYKRTPEVVAKMANTRRGNSGSLLGRSQTKEHILARSLATKGISRPMSESTLIAVKAARAKTKGTTKKGFGINIFNLKTGEAVYSKSMIQADKILGFVFGTIAASFRSSSLGKRPKKNLNVILYKNYLIEKVA